jgi:hypothetical protein
MSDGQPEAPRQRHLSVKVSEKTIESLWPLQVHYGLGRGELIERLVEDALEAREREIAERPKATPITRLPVTHEDDEPDGGSRPTLDANGRWAPWWKT